VYLLQFTNIIFGNALLLLVKCAVCRNSSSQYAKFKKANVECLVWWYSL